MATMEQKMRRSERNSNFTFLFKFRTRIRFHRYVEDWKWKFPAINSTNNVYSHFMSLPNHNGNVKETNPSAPCTLNSSTAVPPPEGQTDVNDKLSDCKTQKLHWVKVEIVSLFIQKNIIIILMWRFCEKENKEWLFKILHLFMVTRCRSMTLWKLWCIPIFLKTLLE